MKVNWIWSPCRSYRRDAALLASGVLGDAEKTAVESHFAKCGACLDHYQALATVGRRLDALGAYRPAAEPAAILHARWTNLIKASVRPPTFSVTVPRRGWDWCLAANRPAWAGLAVVWLLILFFHLTAPDLPPTTYRSVAAAPKQLLFELRKLARASVFPGPFEPTPAQSSKPSLPPPRSDRRRDQMAG